MVINIDRSFEKNGYNAVNDDKSFDTNGYNDWNIFLVVIICVLRRQFFFWTSTRFFGLFVKTLNYALIYKGKYR